MAPHSHAQTVVFVFVFFFVFLLDFFLVFCFLLLLLPLRICLHLRGKLNKRLGQLPNWNCTYLCQLLYPVKGRAVGYATHCIADSADFEESQFAEREREIESWSSAHWLAACTGYWPVEQPSLLAKCKCNSLKARDTLCFAISRWLCAASFINFAACFDPALLRFVLLSFARLCSLLCFFFFFYSFPFPVCFILFCLVALLRAARGD